MRCQTRNQLGTPGGAKSFLRRDQIFKLGPIVLNYFQRIFPGGRKFFSGIPLVTGLCEVPEEKIVGPEVTSKERVTQFLLALSMEYLGCFSRGTRG